MATTDPIGTVDPRFGEEGAGPTPWSDVRAALTEAELFWLSTVRVDGRPHVTPLIAVLVDDTMHFCTGVTEQKAKNLEHDRTMHDDDRYQHLGTGTRHRARREVVRITDEVRLQQIADMYETKYGSDWHFEVKDGASTAAAGRRSCSGSARRPCFFAFAKNPAQPDPVRRRRLSGHRRPPTRADRWSRALSAQGAARYPVRRSLGRSALRWGRRGGSSCSSATTSVPSGDDRVRSSGAAALDADVACIQEAPRFLRWRSRSARWPESGLLYVGGGSRPAAR